MREHPIARAMFADLRRREQMIPQLRGWPTRPAQQTVRANFTLHATVSYH